MPYTPIPDGSVSGAWGAGAYPPWFEQLAQQQGMGGGPQKAAAFKAYVTAHPTYDFGAYWNQFRPGGPLANHQFYIPNADNSNNPDNTGQPPPGGTPPPPGQNPNGTGTDPGGNYTSRPTQPGGEGPGHWQRLISHTNGVRNERWVWKADPVAPTPAPAPAPQTDPPEGTGTTATDPPYVGKPKPTGGTTVDGGPSGGGAGGFGNTGGGGMYGGGGGGMGMAGNSVASGGPVNPLPQKPPQKPLPFPNPMPNPQVPPNQGGGGQGVPNPLPPGQGTGGGPVIQGQQGGSTGGGPIDPAQRNVQNAFSGNMKKRYAGFYGGGNPNMGQ